MYGNSSEKSPLTEKIIQYQKTGKGYKDIVDDIMTYIHDYSLKQKNWDPDMASGFLLYFIPRLEKLITNFSYQHRSFECLLLKSLILQGITYAKKSFQTERNNRLMHYHFSQNSVYKEDYDKVLESIVREKKAAYYSGKIKTKADGKRLLILALSNALVFPDHLYKPLSFMLGLPLESLHRMFHQIRVLEFKKLQSIKDLEQRRDVLFAKKMNIEAAIFEQLDPSEYDEQISELRKTNLKLSHVHRELSAYKRSASHKNIAAVLGIPKGSVDSILFYIRHENLLGHFPGKPKTNI